MSLFFLLVAYGVAFALQNKAPFLRRKTAFTDALLKCTYCTGFHAGWLTWLGSLPLRVGEDPTHQYLRTYLTHRAPFEILCWGFASAVFCYGLDTILRWFEKAK